MHRDLEIADHYSPDEEAAIRDKLLSYNINTFGELERKDLAIILRDNAGKPMGGLIGRTGRGWLLLKLLFVPEQLRRHGLGSQLLITAEEEAIRRGCRGCCLDTMSPKAVEFYRRHEYEVAGQLEELDGGHTVTWMKKRFR